MYLISYILLYPIILLVSRLPFWVIYRISDILYFLIYYVIKYRKKVVFNNLYLVFPEKSEKEITQIAKEFYSHFADMLLESVKTFSMIEKEMDKRYHFKNPEIFQGLAKKNKSVALVGAHYANWEWGILLNKRMPHQFFGAYNKLKNPYFDALLHKSRGKFGSILMATNETTKLVKNNIEQNILSAYVLVSDQSPILQKTIYWNKFLGIKVPIHVGAEAIARKHNLAVVYFSVDKIKRGYYEVTFKTIADDLSTTDKFEITDEFLKLVETQIKQKPSLYLWTHKRWKHRDKAPVI